MQEEKAYDDLDPDPKRSLTVVRAKWLFQEVCCFK